MTSGRLVDVVQQRAAEVLPAEVYRYFSQGAHHGVSATEATAAWDALRFRPQVLRDVTGAHTGTSLLGSYQHTPVAIAPTTLQRAAHPDGELATARAAAAHGALMVLSGNSGSTVEEVAATGVDWWLQLYLTAERRLCLPLLERAVAAGAKAVVLTADTPVVGSKDDGDDATVWDSADPSWLREGLTTAEAAAAGAEKATDLGPHDVDWLTQVTGLPVVVKGVLRADDARRCLDAGASAVWVSNHGGRQLDQAASTASCLAEITAEVGSDAEVYVDGGVRSARHVLAALALGARGVFLGRPPLYALAADGERGVRTLLEGVDAELVEALMLSGCPSVMRVPRDLLA